MSAPDNKNETPFVSFEPDNEVRVWAMSERAALDFFGLGDRPVRLVQRGPQNEYERERFDPKANLYAIKIK